MRLSALAALRRDREQVDQIFNFVAFFTVFETEKLIYYFYQCSVLTSLAKERNSLFTPDFSALGYKYSHSILCPWTRRFIPILTSVFDTAPTLNYF
jgi:hypothetical protein